jgi:FkbM family methyltransferase
MSGPHTRALGERSLVHARSWSGPRRIGRFARRYSLTGRILTEWQAHRLSGAHGAPEAAACHQLAVPGSLAVDVGASVGNFTRVIAKAVGRHGHVLALEASPSVYEELRRSTWAARVSALNLAASSEPGWAELSVPFDGRHAHDQLSTLEARDVGPARRVVVRRARLDDLIGADRSVSLIKIDVEGHESDVLAGAVSTLERWRPALVVEIEQRHLVGRSVTEVVDSITGRGYDCWGLQGRALLPWASFDLRRDQFDWLNPNAHPGAAQITRPDKYVNNFLFAPSERASEISTLMSRRFGTR